jgi:RNA polymerase sigma-70 factor (ECF subfamily)
VRPWVFAIAARVRLDELRRRRRLPEDADEEAIDKAADPAAPAPAAVAGTDLEVRVQAAVSKLPESQRVIVHLNRFEDMSFSEIAETLGTSTNTVKMRAWRAYDQLRAELQDLWAEEKVA